ncbi:arylamine N-acetyltransferase, partial [Mycolicibacterium elephantis]
MTVDASPGLDLAAYFNRIGYTGSTEATVDTLRALVSAHLAAIPFENLDPLMGRPVANLSAAALSAKLVQRRRGGYCFEQNGLMGYVLAQLG